MMKKKVLFFLLTFTVVFFGSCSSDDENKEILDMDLFEQILDKQLVKDVIALSPGEQFTFSAIADCFIAYVGYGVESDIDSESGQKHYQFQFNKVDHDDSLIQQYENGFLRIDHPDKRNFTVTLIEGAEIPEKLHFINITLWGVKYNYLSSDNYIRFEISPSDRKQ